MTGKPTVGEGEGSSGSELESTASLLSRIRAGDDSAQELLLERYLPALRRWATGRLPWRARHLADTDDIVQITLVRTLKKVRGVRTTTPRSLLCLLTTRPPEPDPRPTASRGPTSEAVAT